MLTDDEMSENEEKLIVDDFFLDDESFRTLQRITRKFQLTFKQIKNKKELKETPLSNYTKEEIQY